MNKKTEINTLNTLFFLLVVFIHVSSEPIKRLDRQSVEFGIMMVLWHLTSFVMQGFVFLSGLKIFLNTKSSFSYPQFIWRRFYKTYLPFVIWTLAYFIYFWLRGYYELSLARLGKYLWLGNIVSPFYFIVVIMQFYLLMPLWRLIVEKVRPAVGILSALVIMVLMKQARIQYNDRIFTTYLLFWIMGCYAGRRYDDFKAILSKRAGIALICTAIGSAAFDCYFKYRSMTSNLSIPFQENLHLLYSVATILALTYIFSNRNFFVLQKISYMGFTVFLSHVLFMNIINERMDFYGLSKISLRFGLRVVFVYSLSLLTGFIWRQIVKKVRLKV